MPNIPKAACSKTRAVPHGGRSLELRVSTALAVPSPAWVSPGLMGWAEQVLPARPTDSPTQGKGYSTHPSRESSLDQQESGQRKEWKQHHDVGWETRHLQCRSEGHPRDGDRDKSGDKVWNPAPESLGRKCVGDDWSTKYWCPRGIDMGREVSALKNLQSNQKWKIWLALGETRKWSCKHLPSLMLLVADEGSEGTQAAGRLQQPLFNITTIMKLPTQHSQEYRTQQVKGKATSWTWLGVPTPCLNNLRWWEVESRKLLVKP